MGSNQSLSFIEISGKRKSLKPYNNSFFNAPGRFNNIIALREISESGG